ncbi:carboxymuconolactone decarboxylase family protein [Thalassovita sp.]|uniref:carboxymuconolactone decarboxylase family protein n=1 Tax=Thalassovita sp. TaxID=1979401 RepID=UPI0029DE5EAF|nr:carboxymuconolactone decarboxylase family protein [Thalassovita sp.]
MAELSSDQQDIKAKFIARRGYWRPWTEVLLHHDAQFVADYADYAGYPAQHGSLSARMVELIYVALDSSATHLFEPGLVTHLQKAREAGASTADLLDVLHIVACQGLSGVFAGAEILAQETGLSGPQSMPADLREQVDRVLPHAGDSISMLAALDPGYLRCVLAFLDHDGPAGGLDAGERSLIEIALHACFTGFSADMLRQSIRAALAAGRCPAEIMTAMQLTAHLSVHGTALAASHLEP